MARAEHVCEQAEKANTEFATVAGDIIVDPKAEPEKLGRGHPASIMSFVLLYTAHEVGYLDSNYSG